jgi:hypothetical protein
MKKSGEDFWRELRKNRFFDELKYFLKRLQEESEARRVRLVLVLNPRSTQAKRVEVEILNPLNRFIFEEKLVSNVTTFRYEVQPTHVDDNAEKLASCLLDGDIILVVGGDGTASIGVNGAILSGKKVKFYSIPYGNFNDIARTMQRARGQKVYAMEALVDEKHFRYALCYFTAGMLAESTKIFNEKKNRERLRRRKKNLIFSLWILFVWFIENRKKQWFFRFRMETLGNNGKILGSKIFEPRFFWGGVSDLIALNGATMARILGGGEYYLGNRFLVRCARLGSFFGVSGFMLKGIFGRVSGSEVAASKYIFEHPASFEIQAEGELKRFDEVLTLEFRKVEKSLQIL